MTNQVLIIFAKAPIPGEAKTRMIPKLGKSGAAMLHAQLVEHTLLQVSNHEQWDTQLWCASDLQHAFFQQCADRFSLTLCEQQGRDLGERMCHALQRALEEYRSVVIIGTDCPLLNTQKINSLFQSLDSNDSAFIPAEDGGYVAIGAKQLHRQMFENINWGTSQVMKQTQENLAKANINLCLLPMLWDVDVPEDLLKLQTVKGFNQALAIS